jgi:hypothetical protein
LVTIGLFNLIIGFVPVIPPLNDIFTNWRAYRQLSDDSDPSYLRNLRNFASPTTNTYDLPVENSQSTPFSTHHLRHFSSTLTNNEVHPGDEEKYYTTAEVVRSKSIIEDSDRLVSLPPADLAMEINNLSSAEYSDYTSNTVNRTHITMMDFGLPTNNEFNTNLSFELDEIVDNDSHSEDYRKYSTKLPKIIE